MTQHRLEPGSWDEIEKATGWRPEPVVYDLPEHLAECAEAGDTKMMYVIECYRAWLEASEAERRLWRRLARENR